MKVSYIIPAHNSAAVIQNSLEEIAKRLTDLDGEIIVAENGSRDGTIEILADVAASWPHTGPTLRVITTARGLGHALREGIAATTGRTIVFTADDLPFGFDELDAFERMGFPERTIVIGSKAHPESVVLRSLLRNTLTGGLRILRRVVLGMRTADPQGTYVMDGEWARTLQPDLRESGFLITTEIAFAADLAGIPVVEVPVRLRESGHRTRIRAGDVVNMFTGTLALRKRRRALERAVGTNGGQR
ncbi:glycosyltransferase family 2 protein [Virgisporangium ochraceum]|uniref:Glycosyl transferase n=1 Tax=Virgisporangium ochraceum TaxID=65505 RepID=A0A8J4A2V1_9ACTN|nr:glycosyltransferase [Virgisporangium ochraceum]GIJ74734.1 glycosyl transferase [Virgisporangium ochraceum]